jgi:peroxiredoxin
VLGISTNHSDSQKAFANNLKLDYPLLSAFDQPDMITSYVGWLDKERRLANRAYFVIDKEGTVRFKKVMENPAELVPMEEIGRVLEDLK